MPKITKAVIPAAGLGSRFLPVTKAIPKEMLPIVDKPTIQYVVEELASSGIKDIIIVTDSSKTAIEDHFDHLDYLEEKLAKQGKKDKAKQIKKIADLGNFIFIRQKGPYGNGTPALCAEPLVKNEPFIYIWGDEFIHANPPRVKQMLEVYKKYKCSVISAIKVAKKEVSRYGVAKVKHIEKNIHQINEIVEKPPLDKAPSRLATHGAYLLTPTIFKFLKKQKIGQGGELWLVDAINKLAQQEKVLACLIKKGRYYDIGNKLGYIKANIEFGLKHPEIKKDLKKYLKNIKSND
ncbi:MAG: UTP--glucose-1-phosphate uridylyltransferase [Patescibacteria group bacterium]|nr:UTP--glucose-1-phosphate uridylyltransferase [Patescibacteria group bacterium]